MGNKFHRAHSGDLKVKLKLKSHSWVTVWLGDNIVGEWLDIVKSCKLLDATYVLLRGMCPAHM